MRLVIHGAPVGKGRPRHGNGRTWTPRETVLAEQEIRRAWEDAGSPRLTGPLAVHVCLVVVRPRGHYRKDGDLTAEGLRHPHPDNRKPDVDNALKLCLDALNTRAWEDDVRIVSAHVERVWGVHPLVEIEAASVDDDWGGYMTRQPEEFDGRMGGQG
jgi:Holliday junction resolvase RusA-like endonuclease